MTSTLTFDEVAAQRVETTYRTPSVVATRIAALRALEPRPGEHIADLGCGPGFMTCELARAVGATGRVHAIDLSEPMLALARRRCADVSSVELVLGDMTSLPIPDRSVDAAVAMQSLAYVPDAPQALVEITRVLRPGGRAVVLDTDFASLVWHGADQPRVDRIMAAYDRHVAHPGLPRILGAMAARAGLITVQREIVPIFDVAFHPNTYAHGIAAFIRDFVVNARAISPHDADAWLDECAALDHQGAFFMSLNRYLFTFAKAG